MNTPITEERIEATAERMAVASVQGFMQATLLLGSKSPTDVDANEFIMEEAVRAISTGYALLLARIGEEHVGEAFASITEISQRGVKLTLEKVRGSKGAVPPGLLGTGPIPTPVGNA